MIADSWFYALAIPAVLLTGVSKAGFGGVAGAVAVPLMAIAVPAPRAAAIMLPILLIMDAIGLVVFRKSFDSENLRRLLPGALIGLAVGAAAFRYVDPRWVRLIIGIEAIAFALDRMRKASQQVAPAVPSAAQGWGWGAASGFTSFVSHAGGPPLLHYLMPQQLDHRKLIATTVIYFAILNFVKLAPYQWLGLIDMANLATSAALLPVVPIGYWLGLRLLRSISTARFGRIMNWVLLLTGTKLIADALLP